MSMRVKMEVVINSSYGGFSLSRKAQEMVAARKGLTLDADGFVNSNFDVLMDVVERNDPVLVEVVRALGAEANGSSTTDLKIVKVETEIEIRNHDGMERVFVYGGEYL